LSKLLACIAAVVIVVTATLAFAPATLVDARLAAMTGGRLRIADATGSLRRGRGVLADSQGVARLPLRWQSTPMALAGGVLDATITLASTSAPTRLRVERDRVQVAGLDLTLPAASFAQASVAGGDVRIRADAFEFDGQRFGDPVNVEWRRARVLVPPATIVDLGTVTAKLDPGVDALSGPIEARGGHVAVDGTLTATRSAIALDLRVTPTGAAPPSVRDGLAALGTPDAAGAVRLTLSQPLR
jgi:general secretion pathway protein N